jgi:hypothetical protein
MSVPFSYTRAGKYLMLGGAEEILSEAGSPGDMWKAEFKREEPGSTEGVSSIVYRHKFKTPKGLSLRKEVLIEPDVPAVFQRYVLYYAGRGDEGDGTEKDGDGTSRGKKKPDQTDISFGIRMTTSVPETVDSASIFYLPTSGEVTRARYHRPAFGRRWTWRDWRQEYFGLSPGFAVSCDECTGAVLAAMFRPRRAHVSVRSEFAAPELTIRHATRKVKKGRRLEFGLGLFVADAHAVSGSSLLLLTRGRRSGGETSVGVTLRTSHRVKSVRARLAYGAKRRTVALRRREIPRAGAYFSATLRVSTPSLPLRCSVAVGKEHLSCVLGS